MKMKRPYWQSLAWTAVVGMCLPPSVSIGGEASSVADDASRPRTLIHDVALAPGGLLVGQIVDQTMQPIAGAVVEIQVHGQTTATAMTDDHGVFAVTGLRGGVHQVVAENGIENCRLWSSGTAPPHAADSLRFVPETGDVVRGQWGSPYASSLAHRAKMWATNPWVIGGVIATAIAVPIILHHRDRDRRPAS